MSALLALLQTLHFSNFSAQVGASLQWEVPFSKDIKIRTQQIVLEPGPLKFAKIIVFKVAKEFYIKLEDFDLSEKQRSQQQHDVYSDKTVDTL